MLLLLDSADARAAAFAGVAAASVTDGALAIDPSGEDFTPSAPTALAPSGVTAEAEMVSEDVILSAEVGVSAAGGAARADGAASITPSTDPSPTLSPTFTDKLISFPACELGISIEALSLSTVIRLCSTDNESPGETSTSIISTSLKSPMSGTLISMCAIGMSSFNEMT
jgi:hypothetical protein